MDLKKLKALATKYNGYLNGDMAMYDDLNELPASTIKSLKNNFSDGASKGRPVNLLRYVILNILESGTTITPETLDSIKDSLERRDLSDFDFLSKEATTNFLAYPEKTKSFYTNWKNAGSILFPFFFTDNIKKEVNKSLDKILDDTIKALGLKDVNKHKVDFNGPQNYGSGRIWGAIYPSDKKDHKEAFQLFFGLDHKGLDAGIAKGSNVKSNDNDDREVISSIENLAPYLKSKIDNWEKFNANLSNQEKPSKQLEEFKVPLNQIFYGPPGTGKTYNTISEAVKIVEELSDVEFQNEYEDRNKLKAVFEYYVERGQIAFSTFHQSMSYEDFVEGIKPETVEMGEGEKKVITVTYPVKAGIFKELCRNAESYQTTKKGLQETDEKKFENEDWANAIFYKMSLGMNDETIFRYCMDHDVIALGYGDNSDFTKVSNLAEIDQIVKDTEQEPGASKQIYNFKLDMKIGNYVVIPGGMERFKAIGKVVGEYEYKPETEIGYRHFRKVDWLIKDVDLPISELYGNKLTPPTIKKLNQDLIKRNFFDQFKVKKQTASEIVKRNFVLIIDEINRGNVSQIFGELITLLEEDKRKGNAEALEITLPYSPERFGVPNNLYIIGTMNTADRSVETLDTALRRRFMFREMPPVEDLISPEKAVYDLWETYNEKEQKEYIRKEKALYEFLGLEVNWERDDKLYESFEDLPSIPELEDTFELNGLNISGVHLKKLLAVINYRIEKLLDKDHAIGHAYFIHVYSAENPTAALKLTFQKNIIPLLQEYFYGDYGKIGLVLGDAFVKAQNGKKLAFAKFKEINADIREDYESRTVYTLTSADTWKKQDFIDIYE